MTPAQRSLILHALGLEPRGGRMPRWSRKNRRQTLATGPSGWDDIVAAGWAAPVYFEGGSAWHVTRAGAEAAGVGKRVRKEDLGR